MGCFFIMTNVAFYLTMEENEKIMCRVKIPPFPGLLDYAGRIFYQVSNVIKHFLSVIYGFS